MNRQRVEEKIVVITGGTKGLGRALSLKFGKEGYYIIALFRSDINAANFLEDEFASLSIKGCIIQHDITTEPFPVDRIPEAMEITLINNAYAAFEPKPLHLISWPEVEQEIEVILKGGFLLVQALLKKMLRAREATIINILSSVVHGEPPKGFAAYVPAKYALWGLTKALAAEYSSRGIKIFSISPGFMNTPSTRNWSEHLRKAILADKVPVKDPMIVAEMIFDLAHSEKTIGCGEDYLFE